MSILLLHGGVQHRAVEASRWLGCAALVLGVHLVVLNWPKPVPAPMPMEPPAIMIELAELPVAPPAEPVEVPPGPQMVQAPEKVEQETPPDPLARAEDVPPPPLPEIQEPLPQAEAAPVETIEVPLPPPLPLSAELTPPEKKIEPPKERPKPKPKPKEKVRNEKPPAPRTSAAPALNATPAPRVAAPSAGASSSNSMSPANWRSQLMAHLNRNKRYPSEARARGEQGRPRVAFTINRSGAVLSARLVGSSGSASLDEEAVAMVRRSSPVPPPPPEMAGSSFSFTVPVLFNMR